MADINPSSAAALALQLIADVAPAFGGPAVSATIAMVAKIVPIAISEASDALPIIQNIIGTLRGAGASDADMQTLAAAEVQIDAGWDAATADIPDGDGGA